MLTERYVHLQVVRSRKGTFIAQVEGETVRMFVAVSPVKSECDSGVGTDLLINRIMGVKSLL